MSTWADWSPCSKSCHWGDIGQSRRARSILVPPQHGGEACPSLDATKSCNDFPCPVDCKVETNMTRGQIFQKKTQVGSWSGWSSCSKTCNSGQSKRRRLVETQPEHGGISCPVLKSSKTCNEFPCPIDCEVSCSKLNTAKICPGWCLDRLVQLLQVLPLGTSGWTKSKRKSSCNFSGTWRSGLSGP